MRLGVCLSVRPFVSGVPRPNSRTERPRKPKIGSMDINHTDISWTCLKVKRSKVNINRPINAETESVSDLPNGKAYELRTWYTQYGVRRPVSPTSDKVKGQGHDITYIGASDISQEQKSPTLVERLPTRRPSKRIRFKVIGQRSRSWCHVVHLTCVGP